MDEVLVADCPQCGESVRVIRGFDSYDDPETGQVAWETLKCSGCGQEFAPQQCREA